MSDKALTDRKLLELAAKAYADPLIEPAMPNFQRWIGHNEDVGCDVFVAWNPLTDDGDEARLEAALSLAVEWDEIGVTVGGIVTSDGDIIGGEFEPYHNHPDKQAARRRAGVRAAAEVTRLLLNA